MGYHIERKRVDKCKLLRRNSMSKVYLSGPISGYDYSERKQTFYRIQQKLEKMGHEVFNPMFNGLPEDASTQEHMKVDFRMLLQCDTIFMLPKWNHSAGCLLELNVATSIGCEVRFLMSKEPLIIVDTKFE